MNKIKKDKKNKKRRFISIALAVALMVGLFTGVNFSVSAESGEDADRTGWTAISNRAGLEAMKSKLDGKYYLTSDIDLSSAAWNPVGQGSTSFKGTFDGNGYVISNMKITGTFEYSGLFGSAENAVIENVGLEGININITADYDVHSGGICGNGKNTEILNSYVTGSISVSSGNAGGLIGSATGAIKNCYTAVNVSVGSKPNSNAGGLAGKCAGALEISNCYATGNVTASSTDLSVYTGGLIGRSRIDTPETIDTVVTGCYRLSSQSITGGGKTDQSGTPLDDSKMKQKSSFAEFDFNKAWGIDENKGYPYLRAFVCSISISVAAGRPGKDMPVYAEITNNPGIAAYKLIVSYDKNKLEYTGGTDNAIVGADGLLELYSIHDDKTNGRVVVVAVNASDKTDDGLLFTLKFKAKTGTLSGDYPLTLSYTENTDVKNESNMPVNPKLSSGGINIVKLLRGDANGDKIIDIGDLICLARHFAKIEMITDSICLESADVDNDLELAMSDLIRLAQHISEADLLPPEQ